MSMCLQFNSSGGWRNVLMFEPDLRAQIEFHAPTLADLTGVSMRILDEDKTVVALREPGSSWTPPPWAKRAAS